MAALVASVLFGLYHFAHSPPFDMLPMVLFLMGIGLVTSAFFFVSRDAYATIVFHNFLGTVGVLQALKAAGDLARYAEWRFPVISMAFVALAVLIAADATTISSRPKKEVGPGRRG